MSYYSISSPARFCEERNIFESFNVIVDIENNRIELVSEDKKNVIRLDLIGVSALEETLQKIANSKHFQSTLKGTIVEHGIKCTMNARALRECQPPPHTSAIQGSQQQFHETEQCDAVSSSSSPISAICSESN